MSFIFDDSYYKVGKNGVSPFQNMAAYLGGSAIQTVGDNPVTAYRQLVQQYAKNLDGVTVDPKVAQSEANAVFLRAPVSASLSGLWPRMIGVLLKRVPKFGFLLGYGFLVGEGEPGFAAATAASILSAPFINPVRMVEKQQRTRSTRAKPPRPTAQNCPVLPCAPRAPCHGPDIPHGICRSYRRRLLQADGHGEAPHGDHGRGGRQKLHASIPRHHSVDGPLARLSHAGTRRAAAAAEMGAKGDW